MEEGGKTSSAPTPGFCLSQAPGWRAIAGVRGGVSQQKCQVSPTHKKKHQKSRGPGPSRPSPLYEKVQNIITKRGSRRGP